MHEYMDRESQNKRKSLLACMMHDLLIIIRVYFSIVVGQLSLNNLNNKAIHAKVSKL